MTLDELRVTAGQLGLQLPDGPRSGVAISAKPPRIERLGDRGVVETQSFRSEDELCRYLLVGLLVLQPIQVGVAAADAPRARPRLPAVLVPKTGFWERIRQESVGPVAPTLAWSRELPVHSGIAARGQGLLLLTDTGGLVEHGPNGALQLTALDIVTGAERWSLPIWPPAATRTVAVTGSVTVLASGNTVTGLDTASGRPLWRHDLAAVFGPLPALLPEGKPPAVRVLAYDPSPASDRSVGPVVLLEAGRRSDGTARVAAVALQTGTTLWSRDNPVSDPAFAHPRAVARARLLRADLAGDRLTVTAVRLVDGAETVVTTVDVPPSYAGGQPLVLADQLDQDAGSGLVVIRFSRAPAPGEVGTRLGDLVVAPGRPAPLFASDTLAPSALPGEPSNRQLAYALSTDRFAVTDDVHTRLMRADGTVCWTAPAGDWFGRYETLTVHWPGRTKLEAITDDGAVAWSGRSGTPVVMHGRQLWMMTPARMEGVDAVAGMTVWRRDLRVHHLRPTPNGLVGWSEADHSAVTLAGTRLTVHRAG